MTTAGTTGGAAGGTTGGRDQRAPMERLIGLLARLHAAGRVGVPAAALLESAGWGDSADGISALNREFRYLRSLGWRIENIAEPGTPAVFRMTAVDNRLKLRLTPGQQTALRRAAILMDRSDLGDRLDLVGDARPEALRPAATAADDPTLNTVVAALRTGALLRFRYAGSDRVVHPDSLRTQQTHWYLRGHEDGSTVVKTFVVSRMSSVSVDAPGTATRLPSASHAGLHPMSWEIDPPVDVTLSCPDEFADDVRRWLGEPASVSSSGGVSSLVYRVTHRAALRARIYQLGSRVRIESPAWVRDELIAELATMAGE